jgi:hypothetical protein
MQASSVARTSAPLIWVKPVAALSATLEGTFSEHGQERSFARD